MRPGTYEVEHLTSLSRLIERAGGFTERAYLRKVEIHRGAETNYVDIWKIRQRASPDVSLRGGDVIVVKAIAPL
jgi:protein involved in polysaccharide export with SLBB domain